MITTLMAGFAFGYCLTDLMLSVAYKIKSRQEALKSIKNESGRVFF